jgi:hypothetical protein
VKALPGFLLRYLLVAAAASAAVWFGAGFVKPQGARNIVDRIDSLRDSPAGGAFTAIDAVVEAIDRRAANGLPRLPSLPSLFGTGGDEDVPAIDDIAASPSGNTQWGVVNSPVCRAYSRNGKFLRRLEPGTVVDVARIAKTDKGSFAVCDVYYEGRRVPGVAVRTTELAMHRGALSSVGKTRRKLLARQATLEARIEDVEKKLKTGLRKDNPYCKQYSAARDTFGKYSDKVRTLRSRFETSTGAERDKLSDELRALKPPGIRMQREYQAAKKTYDTWNSQNPLDTARNPELLRLEAELALLKRTVGRSG